MRGVWLAASLAATLAHPQVPAPPGGQPHPDALTVSVTARAVAPGEVVRLDITSPRPITALTARAFDKDLATARTGSTWRALVGIDLDIVAGEYPVTLHATHADGTGTDHVQSLAVEAREFPTRQLRVAPNFVNPPPSMQHRIDRERRQLGALFRAVGPEPRWIGSFVRPIEVSVVSGFGVRSVYNGEARAPHNGADFASPTGTPVLAPGGGRVVLAEPLYFTGRTVMIDHGVGLVSLLAHLSRIDVRVGDQIAGGQRVGLVGATGRVTGPHLHWTVRLQGARVDPMSVIAALQD
jgi:murein DD-endopeptidase MepM/ murein hydrolase activator NlpD